MGPVVLGILVLEYIRSSMESLMRATRCYFVVLYDFLHYPDYQLLCTGPVGYARLQLTLLVNNSFTMEYSGFI